MRISPTSFRGRLLQNVCPIIPTHFVKFLRQPHSVASFATVIPLVNTHGTDSSFSDTEENSASCFDGRFQNIPRKLSFHNLSNVNIDSNERLILYSRVLHSCALQGSLNEGKAVHGQVIKNGIDPGSHFWNLLVSVYMECGSLRCARQVLDYVPERDVVSWMVLIKGPLDERNGREGIGMYCEMRKDGVRPSGRALVSVLKACSVCLELDFGTQLHGEVIKIGVLTNLFVGSALVDLYAKCGKMELATRVFFYMPEKNAVSYNVLLDGYAQMGEWEGILKLFCGLKELELKHGNFTLVTVLKSCAHLKNLREGQVVHALAIKIGSELDKFMSCCLLNMYSKCGFPDDALKVFGRIKNPNIVAWSAMINCLDQHGQSQEAAKMFCLMRHAGVTPNEFTLASVVNAATSLGNRQYCESVHACLFKYGFESDIFVSNALVTMYIKTGYVHNGWQVFNTMSVRDTTSWNALLSGSHDNISDQGPRILKEMLLEGFQPDIYTFVSVVKSCSSLLDVGFGKQVHAYIIKDGLNSNCSVGTALFDMYAKCRCLDYADVILNELIERDLFTWTVLMSSYAQTNQGDKAVKCFSQMQQEGLTPNEFTLSSCLSGCSSSALLESGQQLHSLAIKSGLSRNKYVASALIDMYGQCRCIEDAEVVFKGMDSRNAVSWNSIIGGYSLHGQGKKALEAFRIMLDEGVVPDEITFVGVLSACSHMGLTEEGKNIFNSLKMVYGITPSIEHHACMVNILSRAGIFGEVESFIEKWKLTENALIWETILWASKMHGNLEIGERAAEKLFELEHNMDYNYILLSDIFAAKGRWDDVVKVRALMSNHGIEKEPGCSWLEDDAQAQKFFAQDFSHPKIKEICVQLEGLAR